MKTIPPLFRLVRLPALLAACVLPNAPLLADDASETPSSAWPVARGHQIITSSAIERVFTQDEVWGAGTPGHQILDTGGATRTVTLAPIGANGIPLDTRYIARVSTRAGDRILFRRSDGELLAFWGSDAAPQTQWVALTATNDGWDTHVSTGQSLEHEDTRLCYLGARIQAEGDFACPASPRSSGYAIRFESDASLIYINCRASHPRFRVVADGEIVADVNIAATSGLRVRVPVDLGPAGLKQVEILADQLDFASVEVPDARARLAVWAEAVPPTRMLWIGDTPSELGTHSHPWLAAKALRCEVWNRSWGDFAQRVAEANPEVPPLSAIEDDIEAINPDIIVVSGHFFDEQLAPKDYAAVAGAWFAAIERTSRQETVKIALAPLPSQEPADRAAERRIAILAKEARRSDFHFIKWQDGIEKDRSVSLRGDTISQNVSGNGIHDTSFASAHLADQFVEQVHRLNLERKFQFASMKRRQATDSAPNIAAAGPGR